ncbi:MAG: LVIVD repeat-containing protein [Actinomycetota bacterium]
MLHRTRQARSLGAFLLLALIATGPADAIAARGHSVTKSDNVTLVKRFAYKGSTEVAAHGDFVYTGELDGVTQRGENPKKGGMHVFDVSGPTPEEVAFLHCPGNDNDVEVVKPGLVALGYQRNACAVAGTGFMLIDVREPSRPHIVSNLYLPGGANAHTIQPYPGGDYLYVSPGGLRNGAAIEYIADISNPRKPKVVATFKPNEAGCHDLSFYFAKGDKLAFCSGLGETQIWDVADPVAPKIIGHIVNPAIEFHHYAVASSDGELLAIDDEAFAAHECRSGQSVFGRVWIYDISDPTAPIPLGSFAPPRGGDSVGVGNYVGWVASWCLAHLIAWQPGTHNLAVPWFTGGVSVLDLSNPSVPREMAYYQAERSASYAVAWHREHLYVSDEYQGLLVLEIEGPP